MSIVTYYVIIRMTMYATIKYLADVEHTSVGSLMHAPITVSISLVMLHSHRDLEYLLPAQPTWQT